MLFSCWVGASSRHLLRPPNSLTEAVWANSNWSTIVFRSPIRRYYLVRCNLGWPLIGGLATNFNPDKRTQTTVKWRRHWAANWSQQDKPARGSLGRPQFGQPKVGPARSRGTNHSAAARIFIGSRDTDRDRWTVQTSFVNKPALFNTFKHFLTLKKAGFGLSYMAKCRPTFLPLQMDAKCPVDVGTIFWPVKCVVAGRGWLVFCRPGAKKRERDGHSATSVGDTHNILAFFKHFSCILAYFWENLTTNSGDDNLGRKGVR